MKFAASMISMLAAPLSGGRGRAALRVGLAFVISVAVFSLGFHSVMLYEGRDFSWLTSVYWTLVTMTTLGYGDIVFETDLGRMYSLLVLLTGALLILILLPFTFIQLVYLPWRSAVREARTPRAVAPQMSGHLILTGRNPLESALLRRAEHAEMPHVLVVEDAEEAASLHDDGHSVIVGELDEPATYRAARAEHAAMVVTSLSDQENTNIAFTVREVTERPTIVATAISEDAIDVLELAGVDRVLRLGPLLGRAFARRILAPTAQSSVISNVEDLVIAETSAAGTELVGQTLAQLDLRRRFGVSVVGLWERGTLQPARPEATITDTTILVLTGTDEQVSAYDHAHASAEAVVDHGPVVILGGGRVGRAAAAELEAAGLTCSIVDKIGERIAHLDGAVVGDAADIDVLKRAGIEEAAAVIVTTHDDDMNIYLTLYCRRLRPDVEILGRVARERDVKKMHRAGADFVLSYASIGAIEAWNTLKEDSTLLLAEGLVIFRVPMPEVLAGRTLRDSGISEVTGCTVIGVVRRGSCRSDIEADEPLPADAELLLIGDDEAEERFFDRYVGASARSGLRRWWDRVSASS